MTNLKPFCVDCDVQITHAGRTQEVTSHLNQEFTDNYHQAPHVINLTIYTLHLKNKVTKMHVLKRVKLHNTLTLRSYRNYSNKRPLSRSKNLISARGPVSRNSR